LESHGEVLRALKKNDALVDATIQDPSGADLSPRERAMVDYALKLTKSPGTMQKEDIEKLRAAGLEDADVADVNAICAYFNMLNRISSGLGIEGTPALALR